MKTSIFAAGLLLVAGVASAQNYTIDWYKIAGGGGTSSGGSYTLSGTIAQHDAAAQSSGGSYTLAGGYWSLYAVQTPGLPRLSIARAVTNAVVVFWANTAVCTLQTKPNLSATNWTDYGGSISQAGGTNAATISPPTGSMVFRLKQ